MSEDFMWNTFSEYGEEIEINGCLEIYHVRPPSLSNEIHPIFAIERWMKGHEQHTRDFYHRMKPPLQLASRMITEDCTLPWFHHLTWGERTSDHDSPDRVYIASTKQEHTREGRRQTKCRLKELAHMISWEFTPRKYNDGYYGAWGVTTIGNFPWSRDYRPSDYPALPSKYNEPYYNKRVPRITLKKEFQDFFYDGYRACTPCQRYRAWFMLASTLVHELAHAYFFYLGRANDRRFIGEPRWYKHEGLNELGYSWENITFGRICNPLSERSRPFYTHCICSMSKKIWKGNNPEYRNRKFKKIVGNQDGLQVHRIPLPSGHLWVPDNSWRGTQFFGGEDPAADSSMLIVIHAIPMSWIIDWFSEEKWQRRRRIWKDEDIYRPPSLGPTFIVIYERDNWGRAELNIATKQSMDPNLDEVKSQATVMGLYDAEIPF